MSYEELLISSTTQMFQSGKPLMSRLLPEDGTSEAWAHYPEGDVVNGAISSRYFYHSHPPDERDADEHGHFHLFVGKGAMPDDIDALMAPPALPKGQKRADVVHIAALAIGYDGLPIRWFGTNRWVTDEWLYPADAVIDALDCFDLRGQVGDPLINEWLSAIMHLSRDTISEILRERDHVLQQSDMTGEDREVEVTGARDVSLEALLS